MSRFRVATPSRILFSGLLLGSLIGAGRLWSADKKPTPKPSKSGDKQTEKPASGSEQKTQKVTPSLVKDVTKDYQLIPVTQFRTPGRHQLAASFRLRNRSGRTQTGPLALVVDGVPESASLFLTNFDGDLPDGRPFLDVVGSDELTGGALTPIQRIHFGTDKDLTAEARDALSLKLVSAGNQVAGEENSIRLRVVLLPQEILAQRDPKSLLPGKKYSQDDMNRVIATQEAWSDRLYQNKAVRGHGVTEDEKGQLNVFVYSDRAGISRELPGDLDGIPVQIRFVPGGFRAGPDFSGVTYDNGVAKSPATREAEADLAKTGSVGSAQYWPRPIPIGVSAFNVASGECATGTLGCRVVDASGTLYGLSNNHVFALENKGIIQVDSITQPGPLDTYRNGNPNNPCSPVAANKIGTLWDFEPIAVANGTIDSAIMKILNNSVDYRTPKGGYGAPTQNPLNAPLVGQSVQKVGRTTGYTLGNVIGINVSVVVNYGTLSAGYMGQLAFASAGQFGNSGDSGSLIVTNDRRPVALLFAGGGAAPGSDIIGNPIGLVLKRFNVAIDDGSKSIGSGTGRTGSGGGK